MMNMEWNKKFNRIAIFTLLTLLGARPLLDSFLAGTRHLNLPFFGQDGLSIQSFLSVFAVLLCWAYVGINWHNMPRRLLVLWGAISLFSVVAFSKTPELKTSLSFFFRIQLWFCLFFVFQSLGSEDIFKKKITLVGIGAVVFYIVAPIVDTLISGGKICHEHNIWEMASALYPTHQYSELIGPLLFLFVPQNYLRTRREIYGVFLLSFLSGAIIFFSGVRHVWLGLLVFALLIIGIRLKTSQTKLVKIGAMFLLAGFFGGILMRPQSFINRFAIEIPIVIYSYKKMEFNTKRFISSASTSVRTRFTEISKKITDGSSEKYAKAIVPADIPEPQKITPAVTQIKPAPQKSAPEQKQNLPEPEKTVAEPVKSAPAPHVGTPEPEKIVSEPAKTVPEPVKSALAPQASSPEPKKSVPKPAPSTTKPEKQLFNSQEVKQETKKLVENLGVSVLPNEIILGDLGNSRFQAWTSYGKTWANFTWRDKLLGYGYQATVRTYGREPHSDFFRLLMDLGLLGLLAFLWFLYEFVRYCWNVMHQSRLDFLILGTTLLTMLVIGMFSGILMSTPRAWYFSIFLGLMVSNNTMAIRRYDDKQ